VNQLDQTSISYQFIIKATRFNVPEMSKTKPVLSKSYSRWPALALLLVLSITVYTTTITKSQASFVVAWAQQGNLSSPTSMKSMT
jgi:hypothetical protein